MLLSSSKIILFCKMCIRKIRTFAKNESVYKKTPKSSNMFQSRYVRKLIQLSAEINALSIEVKPTEVNRQRVNEWTEVVT